MNLPVPLCQACHDPGRCCRKMTLHHTVTVGGEEFSTTSFWVEDGEAPALKLLEERRLPFVIIGEASRNRNEVGKEWRTFWYGCTKLQSNGRCGIYNTRPQLCRDYRAGSDGLCAMFTPETGTHK